MMPLQCFDSSGLFTKMGRRKRTFWLDFIIFLQLDHSNVLGGTCQEIKRIFFFCAKREIAAQFSTAIHFSPKIYIREKLNSVPLQYSDSYFL